MYDNSSNRIKRKDRINSIIGYSGKIIDLKHLEKNLVSRPKVILMHGEKDAVVPVSHLLEAKDFLKKKMIITLRHKYSKTANIEFH